MFDYLQKFNSLAKDIKAKVSSPEVMLIIDELEKKYSVDLAAVVMKVMVKDINIIDLSKYLSTEFTFNELKARQLSSEMKSRIFNKVLDYLKGDVIKKDNFNLEENKSTKLESIPLINRNEKISPFSLNLPTNGQPPQREEEGSIPSVPFTESKGAKFFFSAEDEEEIKKLSREIDSKFNLENFNNNINLKTEEIVKKAQIDFGSAELLKRFKEIIKICLRGVRDEIDTKQSLLKSFNDGGLSFDNESASKIMQIIRDIKRSNKILLKSKPKIINLPEDKKRQIDGKEKIKVRDVEFDLKKAIKERNDVKNKALLKNKQEKRLAPPPPVIIKKAIKKSQENNTEKKPLSSSLPKADMSKKDIIKRTDDVVTFESKIKPRVMGQTGKKRMDDVKHAPRVMSPLDELKYMDLISFRRLAGTPEEIKNKILNKLELLEEDKYSKRLKGIRAWRLCPVNKLYLSIGQESISTNKPIDVIIEERKKKGEDYLSHDEFEVILELNKKIRF